MDTNTCIHYCTHATFFINGKKFTLQTSRTPRIRPYIQSLIDKKGCQILIPDVVEPEFNKNIWDVLCKVVLGCGLTTKVVPPFLNKASNNFKELKSRCLPAVASGTSLDKVAEFYADLWKRPEMQYKIEKWAGIKHKKPSEGSPGGADLRILAVATDNTHSQSELVTFDNDYIVFSDEIMRDLGVMITNGYIL